MPGKDGEVCDNCLPILVAQQDKIAGLQETVAKQAQLLGQARRVNDPVKRAREHELWDEANDLFKYWKRKTGHMRSQFSVARFNMVRPYMEQHGTELCIRAIDGIAYDPFIPPTARKNGTFRVFDGWEQAFGSPDKFEEACNKAPFKPTYTLEDDAREVEERR